MDLYSDPEEIPVKSVEYIPESRYDSLKYHASVLDEEHDLKRLGLYLSAGALTVAGLAELKNRYLG